MGRENVNVAVKEKEADGGQESEGSSKELEVGIIYLAGGLQPAWEAITAFRDSIDDDDEYLCTSCYAGDCPIQEVVSSVQLSVKAANSEAPKVPKVGSSVDLAATGGEALPAAALGGAAAAAVVLLAALAAFVRRLQVRKARGTIASKILSNRGHWNRGSGVELQACHAQWETVAMEVGARSDSLEAERGGYGGPQFPDRSGDWEQHVDPGSGLSYFYNRVTGETSWAEAGVMMTGAETEHAPAGTTISESNPLLGSGAPARVSRAHQPAPQETLNPLAAGASAAADWTPHLDPDSGLTYFWNPLTKQVAWEPPA